MRPKYCWRIGLFLIFSIFSCIRSKESNGNVSKNAPVRSFLAKSKNTDYDLNDRLRFIDSAYRIKSKGIADSLALTIIYTKSNLHFKLGQVDSALAYDKKLLKSAEFLNNHYFLGTAHQNLGYFFNDLSIVDSAYYHFSQSKDYFEKTKDSQAVTENLLLIGIIQNDFGDYFGSKESLTEAFNFLTKETNNRLEASIYNELATNHRKLFNYPDAISFYSKAIKKAKSERPKSIYKNNLAASYIDNREYKKAIEILQKLEADTIVQKKISNYARILDNLAYAQWLDQQKVTESQFTWPLQLRKKQNDKRGQIASHTHLGEYFSKTDPKKAKQHLDTVIGLSKQLKIPMAEQDALKFLMALRPNDTKIRDRYIFLQDSLYRVGLKVKTQFAKMKYDDELKQRAILELQAETAKKNVALAKQEKQKIIWLSVSGLLLIVGISFFYGLRQHHKKEKLQEVYTTEQRISKRVHDELANDIYGAMTKIQHAPQLKKDEMLNDLEQIYRQSRTISHENAEVPTGKDFVPSLRRLLRSYKSDDTIITIKGLESQRFNGLENHQKVALYRALNELLVNMKKHSKAKLVAVIFEQDKNGVTVKYVDNGIGATPDAQKGIGLQNTENRIKSSGGTFIFESERGNGFRATITFSV